MKKSILLYTLIALFSIGCSSDPCDELDNIECETSDVDGDGVLNGLDDFPEDPCLPNDNLACPTGDIDGDGINNSEDDAPEDPCLPSDNLACSTGDLDNDGVVNSEDPDPLDPCLPNLPSFEQNVIGAWTWSTFGGSGAIEFDADGTYVETSGDILSNGNVVERKWSIENNTLVLRVKNDSELNASLNLELISNDCDEIVFVGFISDVTFRRA